jgi:hypothetical protein
LKTLGSRDFEYSLTNASPRRIRRKKRSNESIDKKSMNAEMDLILKSVNSLSRTNRSSMDKSPGRHSSIEHIRKKNKLANSLRNSRKLYHLKQNEKEIEKEPSEKSLTLDMSLDQDYTMIKCKTCYMYFVQKDMSQHVKDCN